MVPDFSSSCGDRLHRLAEEVETLRYVSGVSSSTATKHLYSKFSSSMDPSPGPAGVDTTNIVLIRYACVLRRSSKHSSSETWGRKATSSNPNILATQITLPAHLGCQIYDWLRLVHELIVSSSVTRLTAV